ncbi:MAG: guanylate kinase [Gemmataceae bacterium]
MSLAPLIVMAGPSGVGKTTVAEHWLRECPYPVRRAVTATTRPSRPFERPEVDYHFWTHEKFRTAIQSGQMMEWAEVHSSDLYGTPRAEVDSYRAKGIAVLLVIDVQGAAQVRQSDPDLLSVFLVPPCFATLESRLIARGDAPDRIARRLQTARNELARAHEFDRIMVNADISAAVRTLTSLTQHAFRNRG